MPRRARASDVLVVGAGIVGAAVALRAAGTGRTVTVVAPSAARTASAAAGGMLGAVGESTAVPSKQSDELALRLRLQAAHRWSSWHEHIAEAVGAPPLRHGTFVCASPGRPRELAAMDAMAAVARSAGLPMQPVSHADVPGLRPAAGHEPARVAFLEQEAWIDAPSMLRAVLAAARATGRATRLDDVAVALVESAGRVVGVDTRRHGHLVAGTVVVCAGARTGELIASAPTAAAWMPPILPAKGVALRLEPPPRLMEPSRFEHAIRTPNRAFACGLHVLPNGDGVYLGASNRVTRWPGITGDATASEVVRLLNSAARELFDDFPRWNMTSAVHGDRPLAADGLPVVGSTPLDGLFVATGTYRNGLLLAPLVADHVVGDLDDGVGLAALRPGSSRLVETASPGELLSAGLRDFAELLSDPEGPPPQPELGLLLATLGRLVLEQTDEAEALRAQVREVLTELPVIELVPEAIIELCHPEFLP